MSGNNIEEKKIREIINTPKNVQLHLMNCNAAVFWQACKDGYNFEDFVGKFMRSEVAKVLDLHLNYYRWEGPPGLYQDFLDECDIWGTPLEKETRDLDIHKISETGHWAGFIYRLAHFKTGDSSEFLVDFIPPKLLLSAYPTGHCQDPDQWIEDYIFDKDVAKYYKFFDVDNIPNNDQRADIIIPSS